MTAGPLDDLAVLLGAPGRPAAVVVPDARWAGGATLPDAPAVLWGRPALPAGTPLSSAARSALARTRAAASVRRRAGQLRVRGVHRLDPPALRTGPVANLRSALLRGVVVELGRDGEDRVLDAVCAAAAAPSLGPLRVGAGGTVLTQVSTPTGSAVLRVAPAGRPGDPARAADGLRALAADPRVPALHGAGTHAGASWTAEGRLPGTRPSGVTPALAALVAAFTAALPRSGRAPSVSADLEVLAARLPQAADRLHAVASATDAELRDLPGTARHGDLWAGNLLVDGGALTGVVDWDSWSPTGAPGTDLLHLLATEERLRTRRALGEVFLDRPWEGEAFRAAAAPYWRSLGVRPTPAQVAAIGVAWWAAQVAGDLGRAPALAADPLWAQRNVLGVLAVVDGRPAGG